MHASQCSRSEATCRSEFEDWRGTVASMIQPLPFPEAALADETFAEHMSLVVRRIGSDPRCEVHRTVLGVREGKEGWFHIYCPGGLTCVDDGQLYAHMVREGLEAVSI